MMPKSYKRRLKQAKEGKGFLDNMYMDTAVPPEPSKRDPGRAKKKRKNRRVTANMGVKG